MLATDVSMEEAVKFVNDCHISLSMDDIISRCLDSIAKKQTEQKSDNNTSQLAI
jgi:hypothetical protein